MSMWRNTRPRGRWAIELCGLVLLLIVGPAMTYAAADDGQLHGVAFGLAGSALALMGCVVLPLELRLIRHRGGQRFGTTPDGEPATVLPRVAWHIPHLQVALGIVFAWPAASAVIAVIEGQTAVVVFLIPVLLFVGSYLPALFSGRVKAGGLYLTPTGILHINHGRWWRAPWEDVMSALDRDEFLSVILHEERSPQRGQWSSHFGWRGEAKPTRPNSMVVNTRFLSADPGLAALLILKGATQPASRPYFGTPEPLTWRFTDLERPPTGSRWRDS